MNDAAPLLLRYEHLVRLNDDSLGIPALSRATAWAGLHARATTPDAYDDAISECRIEGGALRLRRRYLRHAGAIEDEVRIEPDRQVTFVTLAPTRFRDSTLAIHIDEPADGALFLRFVYELRGHAAPFAEPEAAALRDA